MRLPILKTEDDIISPPALQLTRLTLPRKCRPPVTRSLEGHSRDFSKQPCAKHKGDNRNKHVQRVLCLPDDGVAGITNYTYGLFRPTWWYRKLLVSQQRKPAKSNKRCRRKPNPLAARRNTGNLKNNYSERRKANHIDA